MLESRGRRACACVWHALARLRRLDGHRALGQVRLVCCYREHERLLHVRRQLLDLREGSDWCCRLVPACCFTIALSSSFSHPVPAIHATAAAAAALFSLSDTAVIAPTPCAARRAARRRGRRRGWRRERRGSTAAPSSGSAPAEGWHERGERGLVWAGRRSHCSQPREEPGRPRGRVGRAWPAVSQICSVIFCEPMVSSLTKKLAPMVDAVYLGRGPH